jgi:predicted phosphoadenosine phosphosulfate sulfurtransferase
MEILKSKTKGFSRLGSRKSYSQVESIIFEYIKTWEKRCYKELPNEAPIEINDKVPSYKKIALCILKNDYKELGIMPKKSKYYSILKRIEIDARRFNGKQLKLF